MKVLLFAEDDHLLARMEKALQTGPLRSETSTYFSPFQAVHALRSDEYDAAVVNLCAAGFTVMELLHAAQVEIPLLVLANPREKELLKWAFSCGAVDFVSLPLKDEELRMRLALLFSWPGRPFTPDEGSGSEGAIHPGDNVSFLSRKVSAQLREERDFISAIFDTSGSLIVVFDAEGHIVRFNRACKESMGYTVEEIKGRPFWDVFLPEEERMMARIFWFSLKPQDLPFELENYWVAKDGSLRRILWTKTAVKNEDGSTRYIIASGIDITERKKVEERLRATSDKMSALVYASPLAIISLDREGGVIGWNAAAERLFGWQESEVLGSEAPFILPEKREHFREVFQQVLKGKSYTGLQISCLERNGFRLEVSFSMAPLRSYTGQVTGSMIVAADITEQKMAEEQLRYLSFYDKLTGLYNRAYFEEELKRLDAHRQLPLSIIIGDVNGLKLVNDTFGHQEGDVLLIEAADFFKSLCRSEDVVARWGGDEFAVLLPQTDEGAAEDVCRRIKNAHKMLYRELPIPFSISLGAATKKEAAENLLEVLKKAEDRMYRNKLLEGKHARNAIMDSIRSAMAEKANETEEHALRLQEKAVKIGKWMGLSTEELEDLKLLASYHDIGMITVPEHILHKKAPLTKQEEELLKRHSEVGCRIALTVPELSHISDEILAHHEYWDGNGYPRGLKGIEIPLLSRILALVHAYDVLIAGTEEEKLSAEDALKELKKEAGSCFDPQLVDAFERCLLWDSDECDGLQEA